LQGFIRRNAYIATQGNYHIQDKVKSTSSVYSVLTKIKHLILLFLNTTLMNFYLIWGSYCCTN